MKDLVHLLQIYGLSFVAQVWFNYFNFYFFYGKLKSGNYTVPMFPDHVFKNLVTFTMAAWIFNAIFCYIGATIITAYCYQLSIKYFGGLSSALIVTLISSLFTAVLFMKTSTGESLSRNEWIAVLLIILASVFAAYSGKKV